MFLFLSFPAIFIYLLDRHDLNLSGTRQFQALDRIYNFDTPVTLRLYWKPLILPMKIFRPLISTMQVLDKIRSRFGYDTQMHIHIQMYMCLHTHTHAHTRALARRSSCTMNHCHNLHLERYFYGSCQIKKGYDVINNRSHDINQRLV